MRLRARAGWTQATRPGGSGGPVILWQRDPRNGVRYRQWGRQNLLPAAGPMAQPCSLHHIQLLKADRGSVGPAPSNTGASAHYASDAQVVTVGMIGDVVMGQARRRLVAGALVLVVAACGGPQATHPRTSSPTLAAQQLTAPPRLSCDGRLTFEENALERRERSATEDAGPAADGLRAALGRYRAALPGAAVWAWRMAAVDGSRALFLAPNPTPPDEQASNAWVSVELEATGAGWAPLTMGSCLLRTVLDPSLHTAVWALDPGLRRPRAGCDGRSRGRHRSDVLRWRTGGVARRRCLGADPGDHRADHRRRRAAGDVDLSGGPTRPHGGEPARSPRHDEAG